MISIHFSHVLFHSKCSLNRSIPFQDIKKLISNIENLIVHNHCLQFRIKIHNSNNQNYEKGSVFNNNNETNETSVSEAVIDDGVVLSDLFSKLYSLTVGRGITYTITECLLDQVSIGFFHTISEINLLTKLLFFHRHLNEFWMQIVRHIPILIQRTHRKHQHNHITFNLQTIYCLKFDKF